ncbi:MAG TPA: mechanosensitive ion channel domain-containing protein [Gemmatimonadaceae bacterium]|nr:mechanosensitive ion channel domain-containing protein [Gemmatimonadaceae bacterium]
MHRPAYRLPGVLAITVRAAIAIALCVAVPRTATAQVIQQLLGKKPAADTAKPASVTSPDSPRASLSAFLEYSQAGDFARAAQYLDVPEIERSQASQLAREFSIVLDRYVYIDLDAISGASAGDTTSGMPAGVQQIGTIPEPGGRSDPVRLVRQARPGAAARWVFSRSTVANIPKWYRQLPDRWTLDHLPPWLLGAGPLGILWWQWLGLIVVIVVSLLVGMLLGRLARGALGALAKRTKTHWDDGISTALRGPFRLAAMLVVVLFLLPWLSLNANVSRHVDTVIKAGFTIAFFWALWRLVDIWRQVKSVSGWAMHGTSHGLLTLVSRLVKMVIGIFGFVSLLATLGYPVAAIIGGLGIGGLAVALAAQKTLENLFGAFAIGGDRLFREGDQVTIDTVTGTVESIGLRSIRIRTAERSVVSMPNGKVADSRIETFAPRDRIRFSCVLTLVYETTADQMRAVITGVEAMLKGTKHVAQDTITVFFQQLSPSSLDVQVAAQILTTNGNEFNRIRQDLLLQIMDIVERAGTSFAFPTQTVQLESPPAAAATNGAAASNDAAAPKPSS